MFKVACLIVVASVANAALLKGPVPIQGGTYLAVEGKKFMYGDDEVYLSGTNPAWINYGNDFGNNQWDTTTGARWTQEMQALGAAGGNSVRVWVHIEGERNPQFNGNGLVTGTDAADTLIPDLRKFLDVCQSNGIFLNLVLWNGALMRQDNYKNLFYDDVKLQSYIDNALVPMVNGLKDHPALGAWEVMNEPEGSSPLGQTDANPCFDFTHLDYTKELGMKGPGWSGAGVPIRNILHFHNWIADAIHENDPKALVNAGSWSHFATSQSNAIVGDPIHQAGFNHYQDSCLLEAGGRPLGTMDFWQFHAYPYNNVWQYGQPWTGLNADDYEFDAPVVVGEFPSWAFGQAEGQPVPNGDSTEDLVEYLYTNGFNGGWTWFYGGDNSQEEDDDILAGTRHLAGRTEHGLVDVEIN